MSITVIRTDSNNPAFRSLVVLLDQELSERDGEEHAFFARFNKIDQINHVVLAYKNGKPAGCGAIKQYSKETAEIKRMFVHPQFRRQGIAKIILSELERWAEELEYSNCILETGIRQPEAISLYQSVGYQLIANYGQYNGVESSVCMKKRVIS
jgi:putative acetyltransferase